MTDSIPPKKGSSDPDMNAPEETSQTRSSHSFKIQTASCPYTGYPVYMHPDWKDIQISDRYSVTFQFIGERILLSTPSGYADPNSMDIFFKEREKILSYMLEPSDFFFELKDYSSLEPVHSFAVRSQFAKKIKQEQNRLIGFIGYHAPLSIKLAFGVGKRLLRINIPILIEDDYRSAVTKAVEYIQAFKGFTEESSADSLTSPFNDRTDSPRRKKMIIPASPQYAPSFFASDSETDISEDTELYDLFDTFEDDILFYLGKINWEIEGLESKGKYWREHPFKRVFNAIRLIKFDHDTLIREKNISESALKNSEKKYRLIIENIQDGYFETDLNGFLTFFNEALIRILNTDQRSLLNKNITDYIDRENIQKVKSLFQDLASKKTVDSFISWEMKIQEKNIRYVEASLLLIEDEINTPVGFQGMIRDVTEQVLAEKKADALEIANINLEKKNRILTEFIEKISRDIRPPLNGIVGISEIIKSTPLNEKQLELFSSLLKETDNLLWILNSILDYSKIDSEVIQPEEIPFNLRTTIEDVVKRFAPQAEQKGILISAFFPNNTPFHLKGDPTRLRQILINLIGYSLKLSSKGEIWIICEVTENKADISAFTFRIKDSGDGKWSHEKMRVSEKSSTTSPYSILNNGDIDPGINMSKQLIYSMGGELEFEIEDENKFSFYFTLLFKKEIKEEIPLNADEKILKGLRILLVDQSRRDREFFSEYLSRLGCIPILVSSINKALSILKTTSDGKLSIDIILINNHVTDNSTFEFASIIRRQAELSYIPIILISSFGEIGDGKLCRKIGIEGYLTKPVIPEELEKMIRLIIWNSSETTFRRHFIPITRHIIHEISMNEGKILIADSSLTNQFLAIDHLRTSGYTVDIALNGKEAIEAFRKNRYQVIFMDLEMPDREGVETIKKIRAIEEQAMGALTNRPKQLIRTPVIAMIPKHLDNWKDEEILPEIDDLIKKPLKKRDLIFITEKWIKKDNEISNGEDESTRQIKLPIDWGAALSNFSGEESKLMAAIESCLGKVEKQLALIRQAMLFEDIEIVQRELEIIKKDTSKIHARQLNDQAALLENLIHSKNGKFGSEMLDDMEREFLALKDYAAFKRKD